MTIFQRFSRTFLEKSALAKARNAFTIGDGDLKAYHQTGIGITSRTVEPACNTIRNVAAHQGSYLSIFKKNPLGSPCLRGEGRLSFNTLRYNPSGLFAPLRAEQAAAHLPGHARLFSRRREKQPSTMPDRNRNIRDHKRRLLAAKYEVRRKVFKALCRDPEIPYDMRMKFSAKLSKLPRNSAFARVNNRCIMSGRGRAVYKKFRLSRILFRQLANGGQLAGVKKASW